MNVDKASKVESGCGHKDHIGRFLGSFAASKPSSSRNASSPKKNEVKRCLEHSSNSHIVNKIFDGSKMRKSNLSCKRVLCSTGAPKSSSSNQASLLKKNKIKTSVVNSSNSTRTWNASCSRFLCSLGGSTSRLSNLSQASLFKKNEVRSPVAHSLRAAVREKSLEGSSKGQHDCQNDSRLSPKLGSPCSAIKERRSGQSDRSLQSNPARLREILPVSVMRKPIHRTAGLKDPPIYLRSGVQRNESPKDPPSYNLRKDVKDSPVATQKREIQKIKVRKASTVAMKRGIPKPDGSNDSPFGIQKRELRKAEAQKSPASKVSAMPVKKAGATKTPMLSLASHDTKNQPSSSHYQPHSYNPVYHIRCDCDDKKHELSGQNCILCSQDLSCSPHDDSGSHQDDEYKYQIEFGPELLPAVDVLPCGHAYHSECLRYVTPEELASDPQCVLCLSMV